VTPRALPRLGREEVVFRMPLLARVALASVVVLAAGCGAGLTVPNRIELERAEKLWSEKRPAAYTLEERISCFCEPALNLWTRITVRDDKVVAQEWVDPAPAIFQPVSDMQRWATVPELFAAAREGDASYVKKITVEFDATYGFPTRVHVECQDNILDCGIIYEARKLTTIP
jgi:hypothetical protein